LVMEFPVGAQADRGRPEGQPRRQHVIPEMAFGGGVVAAVMAHDADGVNAVADDQAGDPIGEQRADLVRRPEAGGDDEPIRADQRQPLYGAGTVQLLGAFVHASSFSRSGMAARRRRAKSCSLMLQDGAPKPKETQRSFCSRRSSPPYDR